MEVGFMSSKGKLWMSATVGLFAAAASYSGLASASDVAEVPITASVPGDEVRSVIVHYNDLNLRSEAGAERLYHRIQIAAGRACGSERLTGQFTVSPDWTSCVEIAINRAVADVDRPTVTEFARSQEAIADTSRHSGQSSQRG
jgi:UrcA family protein